MIAALDEMRRGEGELNYIQKFGNWLNTELTLLLTNAMI